MGAPCFFAGCPMMPLALAPHVPHSMAKLHWAAACRPLVTTALRPQPTLLDNSARPKFRARFPRNEFGHP